MMDNKLIDETNVQILNTVSPRGDSDKYTINFTLQAEDFSISSGRILIDSNTIDDLKESEKPQAVIDKIKEVVWGKNDTDTSSDDQAESTEQPVEEEEGK